eukprot:2600534-Pleurochrysis_carterae.AAC.4
MALPARRPSVSLSPSHRPPVAPARAGRKTWLARRVMGGLRAPRGEGKEVRSHPRPHSRSGTLHRSGRLDAATREPHTRRNGDKGRLRGVMGAKRCT